MTRLKLSVLISAFLAVYISTSFSGTTPADWLKKQMQQQIQKLTDELNQAEDKNKDLSEQVQKLTDELNQAEDKNKELSEQVQTLQNRERNLQEQVQNLQEQLKQHIIPPPPPPPPLPPQELEEQKAVDELVKAIKSGDIVPVTVSPPATPRDVAEVAELKKEVQQKAVKKSAMADVFADIRAGTTRLRSAQTTPPTTPEQKEKATELVDILQKGLKGIRAAVEPEEEEGWAPEDED